MWTECYNNWICHMSRVVATFMLLRFTLPGGAIPVDNGVIGEPEIECGNENIYVSFNTQNHFDGHVYVKGHYNVDYCRTDANPGFVASIIVPFTQCGTRRQRSLNPPGMYLSTVVIITFHPAFITKVDRAYEIRCYYMEATKTVHQQLDVSMLSTTAVVTETVSMPRCRYEVLRGGPFGEPVRYAVVGEAVYHKWICETPTVGVFCMRVHSCYVDDGHGTTVEIIDYDGCSKDRYIMQNLDYTGDLSAGQETHVFKYADRPSVYFQCQISLILRDNNYCPLPVCNDPGIPVIHHGDHGGSGEISAIQSGSYDGPSSLPDIADPGPAIHSSDTFHHSIENHLVDVEREAVEATNPAAAIAAAASQFHSNHHSPEAIGLHHIVLPQFRNQQRNGREHAKREEGSQDNGNSLTENSEEKSEDEVKRIEKGNYTNATQPTKEKDDNKTSRKPKREIQQPYILMQSINQKNEVKVATRVVATRTANYTRYTPSYPLSNTTSDVFAHETEKSRARRARAVQQEYLIDVASREFNVLDLNDTLDQLPSNWGLNVPRNFPRDSENLPAVDNRLRLPVERKEAIRPETRVIIPTGGDKVCLARPIFYLMSCVVFAILFASVGFAIAFLWIRRRRAQRNAIKRFLDQPVPATHKLRCAS